MDHIGDDSTLGGGCEGPADCDVCMGPAIANTERLCDRTGAIGVSRIITMSGALSARPSSALKLSSDEALLKLSSLKPSPFELLNE